MEIVEKIKGYLFRLKNNEDLEVVRKDFIKDFSSVDPNVIMEAEQQIIKSGVPAKEVQKLCDIHSALFHSKTANEQIKKANTDSKIDYSNKSTIFKQLSNITGHPIETFIRENKAILEEALKLEKKVVNKSATTNDLISLKQVSIHYAKKGDIIYPLLKVNYNVTGPSDVMWGVDDEIRDSISYNTKIDITDRWYERVGILINRIKEMIYKEENILFPICAVNFKEDEWIGIYHDLKGYSDVYGIHYNVWDKAEKNKKEILPIITDEIIMPGGHLKINELTALLNTIPLEITFVDKNDINRYFNEGTKVFKRPSMAIDRSVYSCHPPKFEIVCRTIIDDFKAGKNEPVSIWMEKNGEPMLVTYLPVKDKDGSYLGITEIVQNMSFAKEHFTQK